MCAVLAGALTTVPPAAAQTSEEEPSVVDPLADGEPPPSSADLASSVRALQVSGSVSALELSGSVRRLEPEVRELRTEEREGRRTTVTVNADVLFEFGSAQLNEPASRIVEGLAERIAATDSDVAVVGHTDAIGTRESNQQLSEQRAEAVAAVLRELLGGSRTVITEGRNFSEPVAPEQVGGEDNPEGRARNRRVEIIFEGA